MSKHTKTETVINQKQTEEEAQQVFIDSFKYEQSPFKTLFKIFKGNYCQLLIAVFYFLLQYSPVIILPIITADIINVATYSDEIPISRLIIDVAFMAALFIQNVFTTYLCTKHRSLAFRRVEMGLRSSIARKLQQLSIAYQKEMLSGKIQSKIIRDVDNIKNLVSTLFRSTLSIVMGITSAVIVTAVKNPIVLLFFALTVPCAVIIITAFRNKLRQVNSDLRKEIEETSASVLEMVDLMPITKAHALEKTALFKFNKQLNRVAGVGYRADKVSGIFSAVSWVTFQVFQLICLAFTGILAYKKIIPIGDITLYQAYFASIIAQVNAIIELLPVLTSGLESVRSVGDIMYAHDDEDNEGKLEMQTLRGEFEFKDVYFNYRDDTEHSILNGINLKINPGETVAFVGESGSGKSTMINMLIGFYRPTSGQLLIDGIDVNNLNLQSYRSHIATVPQSTVLFSGSIIDNITYGMENYTPEDIENAIRMSNLQDVLEALPDGIDTNVGENGDKLSGGQKQRIAIARAIIRDARVIFFDEATSALDNVSEKLIQDSIENLCKDRTTFIVAHRLSTIRNADKIAVIENGLCVEFGTYDELMAKQGAFYKYKQLQS